MSHNNLSQAFKVTDAEIARMLYLSDLRISQITGVSEARAAKVRKDQPKQRPRALGQDRIGDGMLAVKLDAVAATAGSDALLRALIAYGWKHDGLPGLTADGFRNLATRIGVAA